MFDLIKTFRVLAVLLVAGFMVNCGGKKEEEELPADDMLSDIETVAPATTKDTAAAIPAKETAAEKKSALASRYTPNFSDNGKYVVQVSVFVSRKPRTVLRPSSQKRDTLPMSRKCKTRPAI